MTSETTSRSGEAGEHGAGKGAAGKAESPDEGVSPGSGPESSEAWHALGIEATLEQVGSSKSGLESSQAAERLEQFGGNRLRPPKRHGAWFRLLAQFHNILIYLLLLAAAATAFLEHWIDTGVILAVVVVNALIGFIQEGKAERALEAITRMLSLEATVIRDGRRQTVAAEALVPGDLVLLHVGDKVPADMRLVKARELRIDEALLTGESVPAEKSTETLPAETVLGDRSCLAYSGTLVTTGNGAGVVVATGDRTELGKISEMVSQTEAIVTPLIAQMNRFGHVLAIVIMVFAVLTFAAGYVVGLGDPVELFMAAVALAVAAIPEGLPAIMTIVLAIGVERMARRSAIIRRLPAVDTLGALTVICSDKTGTLTRNEMTVTGVGTADSLYEATGVGYEPIGELRRDGQPVRIDDVPALTKAIHVGLLCNDSDLRRDGNRWIASGDPMEGALITLAMKASIDIEAVRGRYPPVDTIPFDSKHRFMATLHRDASRESDRDGGRRGRRERVRRRVLEGGARTRARDVRPASTGRADATDRRGVLGTPNKGVRLAGATGLGGGMETGDGGPGSVVDGRRANRVPDARTVGHHRPAPRGGDCRGPAVSRGGNSRCHDHR